MSFFSLSSKKLDQLTESMEDGGKFMALNSQIDTTIKIGSTLVSRNITVNGHRTSVRLEPEMWRSLKEIAMRENCNIHELCSLISFRKSDGTSLTAAIRVFLMLYYRAASTEEGHARAGHGSFDGMRRRAGWHEKDTQGAPVAAPSAMKKARVSEKMIPPSPASVKKTGGKPPQALPEGETALASDLPPASPRPSFHARMSGHAPTSPVPSRKGPFFKESVSSTPSSLPEGVETEGRDSSSSAVA